MASTGKTPISVSHPELALEAHGWDPSTLSSGSNKIREWTCPKGHVYDSQVAKRTMRGQGCPYCSGHRVLAGFNDISTTHPEIAKEANECFWCSGCPPFERSVFTLEFGITLFLFSGV